MNCHQTEHIDNNGSSTQRLGVFNFYMGNSPYASNVYKQNLTTREMHSSKGRYYHHTNNNKYFHNSINSSKQRHNSYSQTHTVDTFLQRQEQYNLSKIKHKQQLLQHNEDECNRKCTFSPNISYSTKSLGNGGNSFEASKSAYNRLYEDSTQRQINYEKKVGDYIKNLKSEANCTRTSHASKTIDKHKIERLYNEYKVQKTKRQRLRNQIDSENGLTFRPHVNTSPQYNKNANTNVETKTKRLMQPKHQKMLIKNCYNYEFLQDV